MMQQTSLFRSKMMTPFFILDQLKKLICLSPALDWMRNILNKNYPNQFNLESFKVGQHLTNVILTYSQFLTTTIGQLTLKI